MLIGYDETLNHMFQGISTDLGCAIWPTPILTPVTILKNHKDKISDQHQTRNAKNIFWEYSFNPLTRIKRGTIFTKEHQRQPQKWKLTGHPAISPDPNHHDSNMLPLLTQYQTGRPLITFEPYQFNNHSKENLSTCIVVLGTHSAHTKWKIVQIETDIMGADVITLKAIANLGILPDCDISKISINYHSLITEKIQLVIDTAYQSSAENIIDRCRDVASLLFNIWYEIETCEVITTDLQPSIKIIENLSKTNHKFSKRIAFNSGRTIAVLHSRCKPNEQEKLKTPPITEDDGQLALQCLSSIMRELSFAI